MWPTKNNKQNKGLRSIQDVAFPLTNPKQLEAYDKKNTNECIFLPLYIKH